MDRETPVDLCIANAGISGGTGRRGESEEQARRILAVNVDGVLNTIHPLIGPMTARGRGQLALVSSLAGFRGYPGAPAYCASKAAVRSYGESLRLDLRAAGIEVSVICPGFVKSRITDRNRFPMPFLMDADRAASIIKRGLERNRGRIAFPLPTYLMAWMVAVLPSSAGGCAAGAYASEGVSGRLRPVTRLRSLPDSAASSASWASIQVFSAAESFFWISPRSFWSLVTLSAGPL